jgi:hypothetical protein
MQDSGACGGQLGELEQATRVRAQPSICYMMRFQVRQQMNTRLHGGSQPDVAVQHDGGPGHESENNSVPPRYAQITTLNIQAGHSAAAWNLWAVVKEAELCKLDIVFVHKTKISNKKHASRAGDYDIIASESSTNNRGGVAIFIQRKEGVTGTGWSCEDAKIYDMNVVATMFVSGK